MLIARCTSKPRVGDVPPARRAIQGNPPIATICGQKTNPPASPATAPRPNESHVREPGPSGWRLIGDSGLRPVLQLGLGDIRKAALVIANRIAGEALSGNDGAKTIARAVTFGAMGGTIDQIGAAIPLRRIRRVGVERLVVEVQ